MDGESKIYDEMFSEGGYQGVYDLHYRRRSYYPLFVSVLSKLQQRKVTSVLEVGCGTGSFAHMLIDRTQIAYRGFDFSAVAVEKAKLRTSRGDCFSVGNALDEESYEGDFDAIVCTGVLEHIEQDREVVERWPSGRLVVCSVPNFDSATHVRFFRNEDEVGQRFGDLIELDPIVRKKKPAISDSSMGNCLSVRPESS